MKVLAFILSIYIFGLNLAPCEDTSMFPDEFKTEVSQTVDHNHQHQGADLCSPFCSCQCCHIHAAYFKVIDFKITLINISTKVFYHFNGLEKDFNPTILQPPQV